VKNINELTGQQAIEFLNTIADIFSIGKNARDTGVILTNIQNAARRSECLSLIEVHHTITVLDDDGEEYEDSLLNWGATPEQYIRTYKAVVSPNVKVRGCALLRSPSRLTG
jgi:hypothetical protein